MATLSDLTMPKLGLTMTEGTVAEWKVAPGGSFSAGDLILIVETDKIANEVEAPADGMLHDVLVPEGETVAVGTPIARWDIGDATTGEGAFPETAPETGELDPTQALPAAGAPRIVATPLARRIASQEGVDLGAVTGSGPRGRIKADDVRAAIPTRAPAPDPIPAPATHRESPPADRPAPATAERVTPSRHQATVARRLTEAKRDTPHFYLMTEVDAGPLLAFRETAKAAGVDPPPSINHVILAAVARALAEDPEANAVWSDGEILRFATVDVGLAVNTEGGLFAPVLLDVGRLSLGAIARAARDLVARTRAGGLSAEDLSGGAITVSNAGMFDVTHMASIISPGQSAILGVGSIRPIFRPDAEGAPVLRREMGLVLSCDHRVFDGVGALRLLNAIKDHLEAPMRLLAG